MARDDRPVVTNAPARMRLPEPKEPPRRWKKERKVPANPRSTPPGHWSISASSAPSAVKITQDVSAYREAEFRGISPGGRKGRRRATVRHARLDGCGATEWITPGTDVAGGGNRGQRVAARDGSGGPGEPVFQILQRLMHTVRIL